MVGPIVPYGTIAVDAPRSIPNDDLVEMLESIPILDPGFLAPADGTHDLRPVFSEQWVVETLASTGATHIEVQSLPPNHPSSEEVVVRYLPAQSTREVEAGFFVYGEEGPSQFFDATEVRTHGNVTVLIVRYPGAPAGHAIASCGGITINIRLISLGDGDPVVDAIEAFIDQANC